MADTVKVPLFGQQPKGRVIGVVIGGVAVSAYMIYRAQKKNAAAQAATQQAAASAAYGYNAYGYGAHSAYGYGHLPAGYYGYGEFGYGSPPFGVGGGLHGYGYGSQGTPTPPAITTNAEWAQAAIAQLKSEGFQEQPVAEALGAYELGRPVTAAQRTIIQAAIGVEGEPPVPGKDDYPPKIRGGGSGGGGGQGAGKVTVPHVEGKMYPQAAAIITASGLKPVRQGRAIGRVTHTEPPAGERVERGSIVKVSSFKKAGG